MPDEKDGLSPKISSEDRITEFISSDTFGGLNDKLQEKVIVEFMNNENKKTDSNTGIIGRILGVNTDNIGLYIAFTILISLLAIGSIYLAIPINYKKDSNLDFWQLILPVISATLGFIFGKGADN